MTPTRSQSGMRDRFLMTVAVLAGLFAFGVLVVHHIRYRIARSAAILSTPATVYSEVNDLRRWSAWSPWARPNPKKIRMFDVSPDGTSAAFKCAACNQPAEGRLTIAESHPNDWIEIKFDFVQPLPWTAVAVLKFEPEGNRTVVTWSLSGRGDILHSSEYAVTDNLERIIGADLEAGLANLKTESEAR
jgi:hypothetical protein